MQVFETGDKDWGDFHGDKKWNEVKSVSIKIQKWKNFPERKRDCEATMALCYIMR